MNFSKDVSSTFDNHTIPLFGLQNKQTLCIPLLCYLQLVVLCSPWSERITCEKDHGLFLSELPTNHRGRKIRSKLLTRSRREWDVSGSLLQNSEVQILGVELLCLLELACAYGDVNILQTCERVKNSFFILLLILHVVLLVFAFIFECDFIFLLVLVLMLVVAVCACAYSVHENMKSLRITDKSNIFVITVHNFYVHKFTCIFYIREL